MPDVAERAETQARETRAFSDKIEMRAEEDGSLTFDGIASTVDQPYKVRDMFGEFDETMVKGSFNKTLKEQDDVRLLVNHLGVPMARTKSNTLELSAAPHLRAVAPLDAANPTVQEVRSAMDRGDIDQMSIGFRVTRQEWNEDYTERWIREVQLLDVSIVTYPANPNTSASLRSLDELVRSLTADVDPDEVRRAITHLESLLLEEREETEESFDYLAHLQQLWAKRNAA